MNNNSIMDKCREDFERSYPQARGQWNEVHRGYYSDDDVLMAWDVFTTAWLCGYAASTSNREKK